jgi:predicted DNA-binding ribbon-helix-helix protein
MKKIFPIELEEDLHRQLKHAAIDAGMTLHALILRTLEENVNHKGNALKKSIRNCNGRSLVGQANLDNFLLSLVCLCFR